MGKSLWGNLAELGPTRTPTTILKEQGRILEKVTKGVLRVKVDTSGDASTAQMKARKERYADITIWFVIVAPLLNYEILIITVTHDPFIYPLLFTDQINDHEIECRNEKEFEAALEEVLISERIRQMLTSLISQSQK